MFLCGDMRSRLLKKSKIYTCDNIFLAVCTCMLSAINYRVSLEVTEYNTYGCAICPRCGMAIDRDYQKFCSSCGQHDPHRRQAQRGQRKVRVPKRRQQRVFPLVPGRSVYSRKTTDRNKKRNRGEQNTIGFPLKAPYTRAAPAATGSPPRPALRRRGCLFSPR